MPAFTLPLPASWSAALDDAGDLHRWLADRGYQVEGVAIHRDGTATVTVDRDPAADWPAFSSGNTARLAKLDEAIADAKALILPIWRKDRAQRTNAEKMILGVAAYVMRDELRD